MKTILIALGCMCLSITGTAQSVPPSAREPFVIMRDGAVVGQLVLDTAQHRELTRLEHQYQLGYDNLMANDSLSADDLALRVRILDKERQQGIFRTLRPEQYEKWLIVSGTKDTRNQPIADGIHPPPHRL